MHRNHAQYVGLSVVAAALVAGLIALPATARAYGVTGVGGNVGYTNPENLDGAATLGVHAVLEQPGTRLHLDPNLKYWNVNGIRDVAPNMDMTYHFGEETAMTPYVGGGLGVNFVRQERFDRSRSDLGVNAIAGMRMPTTAGRWFVEGRYTASEVNQASIATGVTFGTR